MSAPSLRHPRRPPARSRLDRPRPTARAWDRPGRPRPAPRAWVRLISRGAWARLLSPRVSGPLLLAACLLGSGLLPASLGAQTPSEVRARVDSLLRFTELPSFIASVEGAFDGHFLRLSTNLSTLEDVRDAASRAFADSLLYRDVAAYLMDEAEPGRLAAALASLGGGASARMRTITDTTPPPQDFDAFVRGLEEAPPSPDRLALVRRWAEARRAGDFILLLDEAQREAAHRVAAAVDAEAPPFDPIGADDFGPAHASITAYSVLSFLHRLQPVPDTILEAAIREYETEPGQWFVEAYSLALAHAVREASRRIVEHLADVPGAVGAPPG